MDFISSISFPYEPLLNISWPFLSSLLGGFAVVCCCTHPNVMTKMAKKCSIDQRFIRKRNTTYKIHTLTHIRKCALNPLNFTISNSSLAVFINFLIYFGYSAYKLHSHKPYLYWAEPPLTIRRALRLSPFYAAWKFYGNIFAKLSAWKVVKYVIVLWVS